MEPRRPVRQQSVRRAALSLAIAMPVAAAVPALDVLVRAIAAPMAAPEPLRQTGTWFFTRADHWGAPLTAGGFAPVALAVAVVMGLLVGSAALAVEDPRTGAVVALAAGLYLGGGATNQAFLALDGRVVDIVGFRVTPEMVAVLSPADFAVIAAPVLVAATLAAHLALALWHTCARARRRAEGMGGRPSRGLVRSAGADR